jgi:hypothetical protein
MKATRPRGTGSLFIQRGSYYGKWWEVGRQVKRTIGPVRKPGTREGLTKTQAEARLRAMMQEARSAPALQERLTVAEAGNRLLQHLEAIGRKRSTRGDYESTIRVHLSPAFGSTPLGKIGRDQVEAFVAAKVREGKTPKSIRNYLGLLHSIFAHAIRRGWCAENPVSLVDLPAVRRDQRPALSHVGRTRSRRACGAGRYLRPYGGPAVSDGCDDRAAPGRTAGAALA